MKSKVVSLIILISIFLLNDLFFIHVKSWQAFLVVDYGSRILAILIILYLLKSRRCTLAELGYNKIRVRAFIAWSVILCATGILIDHYGWKFFMKILPNTALFNFPGIENKFVKIFDLSIGMILVSLTEETIFRGYCFSVLKDYIKNPVALVAVSAVIFGSIHWSLGLDAVIMTALWSILPMISVIRTGSILPALIAHYATDFMYFIPTK